MAAPNPIQGGVGVASLAYGFLQQPSPGTAGVASVDSESVKGTYSYSTASIALHATPNDVLQFAGAANVVTRFKRIFIQTTTTVAGAMSFSLIRRSTGSTGGTSASGTLAKFDTNDPTNSTLVTTWTVDPSTTGTTVANVLNFQLPLSLTTSNTPTLFELSTDNLKAIVLRGAADFLVLNGNGSTLSNADNKLTISAIFTEEPG